MCSGVDAINVYSGKPKNGQSWTCYAVRIGRKRGIFMDYADAEAQMSGYSDGKLRGALTLGDAEHFVRCGKMPALNSGGGGDGGGGVLDQKAGAKARR